MWKVLLTSMKVRKVMSQNQQATLKTYFTMGLFSEIFPFFGVIFGFFGGILGKKNRLHVGAGQKILNAKG